MNFFLKIKILWKNFWKQKSLRKLKKVVVAPLRSRPRNIQCCSLGYGHGVGWSCRENCNENFLFFWKLLKKFLKTKVFEKVEKSCGRSAPVTARLLILGYGFTTHAGGGSRGSVNFEELWVASLQSWPRIGLIFPYPLSQKIAPRIFQTKTLPKWRDTLSKMPYFKLVSNSRPNLTPI